MNRLTLAIVNSKGYKLNAVLELPDHQRPAYYAIFAHCFTCTSNFSAVRNLGRALTTHGFGVVRFDFTGLGKSEGEFSESHFSANVADLIDVYQYMAQHFEAPALLVGHSLGGAAVLCAAGRLEGVKAVATIGAPADVHHVKKLFTHSLSAIPEKGPVKVNIGGRPFHIDKEFIEDFDKTDLPAVVRQMRKPVLIMHAPFDEIVGIENAQELYNAAFHPKSFISLADADHLLSQPEDSQYAGEVIGAWVKRYFPLQTKTPLDREGQQVVGYLNLKEDKFTTTIQTDRHALIADEPASVGGDDFGPSPYELLNASLAACTAMTLKLYADRKKWDLQEVFVYLTHYKQHVEDMQKEETGVEYMDHISKKIKVTGDLTDEQKNRLLEIADKCPVHRTLTHAVIISSDLV